MKLRLTPTNQVEQAKGKHITGGYLYVIVGYLEGYYDEDVHAVKISDAERVSAFVGEQQEAVYDEYVMIDGELVKKEG